MQYHLPKFCHKPFSVQWLEAFARVDIRDGSHTHTILPIGSMGIGIFTYMDGWFFKVNVGKYTNPMDPMGFSKININEVVSRRFSTHQNQHGFFFAIEIAQLFPWSNGRTFMTSPLRTTSKPIPISGVPEMSDVRHSNKFSALLFFVKFLWGDSKSLFSYRDDLFYWFMDCCEHLYQFAE